MREVKIYATIQYPGDDRDADREAEVIAAKCDDIASALGGEVIDLEIK
ncbi:hypothetical protein [Burkholderia sp. AU45388]|nr:hypothetical protein [Burkholderia sp. AU45388]MDN7427795.1 hypothetical protein [Burkholderia sp. AU45388]